MKIAFHCGSLDVRGTGVSMYDYAHYNETILGNRSVIITQKQSDYHDIEAVYHFSKRFEVRYYEDFADVEKLVSDCDIFYCIKYGKKSDNILVKNIKCVIHCVFDLSEPHGDVYAAVSETLARKFGHKEFVPHMIGLQPSLTGDNMRANLGIPENSIVFGRHGGQDTFDLDMAKKAIKRVINTKPNVHFVFVNTPRFYDSDRVHHLDKIVDFDEKNRFIMTCDAMIHAQSLGETFGISIGEFSVNNKPIIAYNGQVWNDHYKNILGNKALWYMTEEECYNILVNFDPREFEGKDLNCYKKYSPQKVMSQFYEIFIK